MVAYSFKERFIKPIRSGLGLPNINNFGVVVPGIPPKRQTIRLEGKRRHARPKETLQLYYGMRTKSCFLIGRALCKAVSPIEIKIGEAFNIDIRIDRGSGFDDLSDRQIEIFSRLDGFSGPEDMWRFWNKEHPGISDFRGVLVEWEPARS